MAVTNFCIQRSRKSEIEREKENQVLPVAIFLLDISSDGRGQPGKEKEREEKGVIEQA